jgi:hypothetical protein
MVCQINQLFDALRLCKHWPYGLAIAGPGQRAGGDHQTLPLASVVDHVPTFAATVRR